MGHARERAIANVTRALSSSEVLIDEEIYERGQITDIWRHLSLHLAVTALATEGKVLDPTFRTALVDLLELQDIDEKVNETQGGFRTSREGYVTTYATAQALEALIQLQRSIRDRVNPGKVYDYICSRDGMHHTDPQVIMSAGARPVLMNSRAGAWFLATSGTAGLTISTMSAALVGTLGKVASRSLVVWGTLFVAVGLFGFVATRMPATPNGRIAAAVFAVFTALVLPVVTFLISA